MLTPTKDPESDTGQKYEEKDKADEAGRNKRRPLVITGGILVVVLLTAGGLFYWLSTRNLETTDDAYTDGRAIAIAPQVSGMVVSLDVTDNQFVKRGEPLIHIDRRQYETDREQAEGALATAKSQYAGQQFGAEIARKNFPALLEQAQAQLANAKANLTKAQADYDRQRSLSRPATSQQEVDAATAALKQAQAQVMLAEAQVTQNSPVPQRIGETDAQVGQLKGTGRAGASQARSGQSQPVVDGGRCPSGWLDYQEECGERYLRSTWPASLLDRGAGSLGDSQLQGDSTR
jgi:membrane fusion protein (multidrug efflux system)